MTDARVLHRLLLFFILLGLAFSLYATLETVDSALQATCSVNSFISCQAVDSSGHTFTGPVPDWLIGVGGFVLLLALDLPLLRTYKASWLKAVLGVSGLGVLMAVYLGTIELTVIHALCPICLGAYLSVAAAFGVSVVLFRARRGEPAGPATHPSHSGDPA
jgi:uncharacterized membrane protein